MMKLFFGALIFGSLLCSAQPLNESLSSLPDKTTLTVTSDIQLTNNFRTYFSSAGESCYIIRSDTRQCNVLEAGSTFELQGSVDIIHYRNAPQKTYELWLSEDGETNALLLFCDKSVDGDISIASFIKTLGSKFKVELPLSK